MKKYIAAIPVIAVMLTACASGAGDVKSASETSETAEVTETAETTTETATETAETTTVPETETETTPETAEAVSVSPEEKAEIQALLTEAGKFVYDYLDCKEIIYHIDKTDFIVTHHTNNAGIEYEQKWCRVADGEITSLAALGEKIDTMFTETAALGFDAGYQMYKEEDGKLYLRADAGSDGGLLGTDYAYIVSAEEPDGETIILNMTAFGAGENWDLDHDLTDDFTIRLKRTENGLRIDAFDPGAQAYIEWAYTPERDMI